MSGRILDFCAVIVLLLTVWEVVSPQVLFIKEMGNEVSISGRIKHEFLSKINFNGTFEE